ncbi:hypothetical protein QBC42DRAFT_254274 [Cladorrhinum samala]|uniref:Uncharacterized protein n=1 Tax=Cladorrhinum samala TaxID=585594 RepID=A0AAV9HHB7_9PEZI|nr:hypothetical protein QBC42DRAFT_254274 [Cladorrhinum samala]
MTSFGPPPGFTPPASSGDGDGDNNNNNSGGTSLAADHPWTWVLIPVAVLIALGAVAACLHTSRRRRRAAQLRHESSLNSRRLTPSSPHLSPRARHRRHRGQDLEAGATYYHANGAAASRWWSLPPSQTNHHRPSHHLPEEGLNELGEAPPPYEKKLENLVPNPNRNVNNSHNNNDATREGGGGDHHDDDDDDDDAGDDYDEGSRGTETETETETLEMQELPGQNEIAELDAGESSTARAVALSRERDSTIPKEMDACHGGVVIGGDSDDDTSGDDHSDHDHSEDPDHATVVEYRQAYAVTITSGTASRTESPASWTKGDDSSPNGRLRTDRRTRTRSRRRRRRSSVDSGGGDGGSVGEGSVPPGRKTNNNNGDEDDHVHDVEHDTDPREPPRAVLPSDEEGRGRKGL